MMRTCCWCPLRQAWEYYGYAFQGSPPTGPHGIYIARLSFCEIPHWSHETHFTKGLTMDRFVRSW